MSEAVFVEGLTKAYGEKTAVDHLSISVPSGTVFGLLGANGAGKSTTIECILGTKQADAGAFVCWVKTRRGAAVRCFSGSVYSFRRAIISRRLRRRALRRNRLPVPRSGRLACALRAIRHPRQDKRIGQESFRRRASTALYRAGADPAAEAGVFGRADDRP